MTSSQSLVWDAVPGAASYDVELHANPPAGALAAFSVSPPSASIAAAVLMAGRNFGTYNARVRATEPAGPGDWSAFFNFTFENLNAPANLRVE